ncbi:MAG: Asp-tRNA(Asn)/Glu-tRNA(Gln) amidotransferase subunit GatA [Actinobacteria bacterium]|jgi:aspartyl-tRNA(Asn)/glutamyl-tRNA(Gln) amidotransferase subunit A|nr:Asp-tRNA(Asn)/Glu-tRNA(Gln) amidotransferase subunit GatA [Actinomycetota bacterium]MDB2326377.1 Asp-tRNA(Asn)/Glu-tRNA(Gln) amidotransferase subunit GatA [Candidatus Actinomarina sp.]
MNHYKLSISEINKLFKDKKLKPSELYSEVFERAANTESIIHGHLTLFQDENIKKAADADKRYENGTELGILDGIPIAIKDNINIAGYATTCSSQMLSNYISPYDATVITKLKDEGVMFTGKTNLDEFAMGSSTENSAFGPTKNPWDPSRVPGGSSGGSAAVVSAGSAIASLGSDTGGSIRQPASFCGVVGFKPTYGTVSRFGLVAFASSLDQIGPITNNVEDSKILFNSMKGFDPFDATSGKESKTKQPKLKNAKIGIIKELMEDGISEDAKLEVQKVAKLLESQGHEIVEVSLPLTKMSISIYYLIAPAECSANLSRFDGVRYGNRVAGNTSYEMMENTRAEGFGPEVKKRILLGTYALSAGYYDAFYGQALKARAMMKKEFTETYKEVDYLISPTTPSDPFKFGEKSDNQLEMYMSDLCTIPANLVGMPAISIPTGLSSNGLPLSVQIMSPANTDNTLLEFSQKLESVVSFTSLPEIKGDVS